MTQPTGKELALSTPQPTASRCSMSSSAGLEEGEEQWWITRKTEGLARRHFSCPMRPPECKGGQERSLLSLPLLLVVLGGWWKRKRRCPVARLCTLSGSHPAT